MNQVEVLADLIESGKVQLVVMMLMQVRLHQVVRVYLLVVLHRLVWERMEEVDQEVEVETAFGLDCRVIVREIVEAGKEAVIIGIRSVV